MTSPRAPLAPIPQQAYDDALAALCGIGGPMSAPRQVDMTTVINTVVNASAYHVQVAAYASVANVKTGCTLAVVAAAGAALEYGILIALITTGRGLLRWAAVASLILTTVLQVAGRVASGRLKRRAAALMEETPA